MSKNKHDNGRTGHHGDHHHGHGVPGKGTMLVGTKSDNPLAGTERNDKIFGLKGNDELYGNAGSDLLVGGKGNDLLLGGDGNDVLYGDQPGKGWAWGSCLWWKPKAQGDDYLDGGAGNDKLFAGRGDDVANYTLSENQGARDLYDGGKGFDTLQLTLTHAEAQLAAVQADIAAFESFLESACYSEGRSFHFASFDLTVRGFEDLEIKLVGGNTAPEANNDFVPGAEDQLLSGNVLANDTDAEGSALTAALVSGPEHGTVVLGADGSFSYTPDPNFNGEDSFTYLANDGASASNVATVTLAVTPVNDAPVAIDDAFAVQKDAPLPGNVLDNDLDVDGDALSAQLVDDPAHGRLAFNADGSFTYTPDLNFFGTDSFTYRASDGAESDLATVNLTINAAPVAVDDVIGAIRVAVVGATTSTANEAAAQLNDSTAFKFDADPIFINDLAHNALTQTAWESALADYDVVLIGGTGQIDNFANLSIFPALRTFVNEGGGVVSTGWFARALENLPPSVQADADYVTPISTAGFGFVAPGSTITVLDSPHPITKGVSSFVTPELHELAIGRDASADVLATGGSGLTAIAYDEIGQGLTVYLGGIYMADPIFTPDTRAGELDQLFEQAVVWASGPKAGTDEDTPRTIDDALLLLNDTDADGDDLAVYSVQAMSARGATVGVDEATGDIVYDPRASAALQALAPGEVVTDYFDYEISDGNGGFDTGTVGITVAGLADLAGSSIGSEELTLALGVIDADVLL